MSISMRQLSLAAAAFAVVVTGCRPDDQTNEAVDFEGAQAREQLPPDVVAQLDSGSNAYRVDDFERALVHYTRATELGPDYAAGWFGVYMVQHRLGNRAAADSAFQRAQRVAPGASLIHPTAADTIR